MKKTKSPAPKSRPMLTRIGSALTTLVKAESDRDLFRAILLDHQALKDLIKTLKDPDESVGKKKTALKDFSALLKSHSAAEEKALYSFSLHLRDVALKTDEGFVEHDVASTLLDKIKPPQGASSVMRWKSQLQVLGELVEHHLKEEENDLLPKVKRQMELDVRVKRCELFLSLRKKSQKLVNDRNRGALRLV